MYALRLEDSLDQQIYDEGIALERRFSNHSSTDGLYFNTDDLTCPVIPINKEYNFDARNQLYCCSRARASPQLYPKPV